MPFYRMVLLVWPAVLGIFSRQFSLLEHWVLLFNESPRSKTITEQLRLGRHVHIYIPIYIVELLLLNHLPFLHLF